jgi:threonine/homoserine/homoserine lactone efflux protein
VRLYIDRKSTLSRSTAATQNRRMTTWAIFQGIGIGFAIAAPVGPIGMLCIRRTLHHGPVVGLATGLGAATADAMYGLVAAGGLGLAAWLLGHAAALGLVGALLLAMMGVESLRAFVRKSRASASVQGEAPSPRASPSVAFASTFALTASNPMTILSFVGVIAALGATGAGAGAAAWLLVAGVFLGSALWWLILVALVRLSRRAFSPGALRWVDLVTAIILLGTAAWVATRTWAS